MELPGLRTELFRVPDVHGQGSVSQREVIHGKGEGSCRLCSWGSASGPAPDEAGLRRAFFSLRLHLSQTEVPCEVLCWGKQGWCDEVGTLVTTNLLTPGSVASPLYSQDDSPTLLTVAGLLGRSEGPVDVGSH